MTVPLDFPPTPIVGQKYTAPNGAVYEWDGFGWTVGYYDSNTQQLLVVGDILDQVRTLLQDTDSSGSTGYRYSTDSIVTNLNQGMTDLFRIRPDLFLELGFVIPTFTVDQLSAVIGIEQQYIPPIVMYIVGLTQARDDEQTQDARAGVFLIPHGTRKARAQVSFSTEALEPLNRVRVAAGWSWDRLAREVAEYLEQTLVEIELD